MSLETAPPEVKLAVDLIELLETNQLAPELVLAALAIVKNDYERMLIYCSLLTPSLSPPARSKATHRPEAGVLGITK